MLTPACERPQYIICRNFSVNDGKYPGHRPNQGGIVQGLPVAIGTGRRKPSADPSESSSVHGRYSHLLEGSSFSGSDSGSDRRSSSGSAASPLLPGPAPCAGGQAPICRPFDRCEACLRHDRAL